jgi:hypothetical protein
LIFKFCGEVSRLIFIPAQPGSDDNDVSETMPWTKG